MKSRSSRHVDLFAGRAVRFSSFIGRQPAALVICALIVASFLRSGFVLWNWFYLSPKLLTEWANPENAFQSNVVFNAIGTAWLHTLGRPDGALWVVTQIALAILGIALIAAIVFQKTRIESGYLATALVLSSGIAAVVWREIGRYDIIFLVAIAFGLLARRAWLVWVALAVAALSAPEQAILAGIALLTLTFAPNFRRWRNRAIALVVLAFLAALAVQIWFTVGGKPYATRLGLAFHFIGGHEITAPSRFDAKQGAAAAILQKFYEGLANGPSLIWSYLGACLLVITLILLLQKRVMGALWVLFAVIGFPLFTTLFFGEDPTRDLVIVGAPMIILICIVGATFISEGVQKLPGEREVWLIWISLAVSLMPMLYFFVHPEASFDFAIHMLISWNNGTPMDWSGNNR